MTAPQGRTDDRSAQLTSPDGTAEPDVLLDVPVVKVDEIELEVEDLKARVSLQAEVLDLLKLHVGADVELGRVGLKIKGVEAQALLKVRLDNVAAIIDRVLTTIDENPQILEQVAGSLGAGVEQIGRGAGEGVAELGGVAGEGVGQLARGAGEGVREGVGEGVGELGRMSGEGVRDVGRDAGETVRDVGAAGRDAAKGVSTHNSNSAAEVPHQQRRRARTRGSRSSLRDRTAGIRRRGPGRREAR